MCEFALGRVAGLGLIALVLALSASCSDAPTSTVVDPIVEQLIDRLIEIDAQTVGLHGTAFVETFIGETGPMKFAGGVVGSEKPKVFPQMQELVRLGVVALPSLIRHLDDRRPTKLTVGGSFFTCAFFSEEYDPRSWSQRVRVREEHRIGEVLGREYTVRVGDVCYVLVGQIVNRSLYVVRYQPTQGLIINSPIASPALLARVKRDWARLDTKSHSRSLIEDVEAFDQIEVYGPALQRLRFYYPDEFRRATAGGLAKRIATFEAIEKERK